MSIVIFPSAHGKANTGDVVNNCIIKYSASSWYSLRSMKCKYFRSFLFYGTKEAEVGDETVEDIAQTKEGN